MANKAHMDELAAGPAGWKVWRERHSDVVPDISGTQTQPTTIDATGLGNGRDGTGTPFNFSGMEISEVEFQAAYLGHADFSRATLRNVRFVGCDLTNALFEDADLENCAFRSDASSDKY